MWWVNELDLNSCPIIIDDFDGGGVEHSNVITIYGDDFDNIGDLIMRKIRLNDDDNHLYFHTYFTVFQFNS